MKALVVFESMFGNTHRVAEAIADGLRQSFEVTVQQAAAVGLERADLVVVGAPTHTHALPTKDSRQVAEVQADDPGRGLDLEREADAAGVREWIERQHEEHCPFAAFDTRVDMTRLLTGAASRRIAKSLNRKGWRSVLPPESFLVDHDNRLLSGEEERAREWGKEVADAFSNERGWMT